MAFKMAIGGGRKGKGGTLSTLAAFADDVSWQLLHQAPMSMNKWQRGGKE